MPSRLHNRRRPAFACIDRIESLESRTLLTITASAFTYNVLNSKPTQIELSPYVQDSDSGATLTYDLVTTTTPGGGQVSVNPAAGLVTYTPGANPMSPDSFAYYATDSDSLTSNTAMVTLTLASVAANPVAVSEVEGQPAISLTILNLPGAVQDASSKPTYTFSNALVNPADGTVSFTEDTKDGEFTYTPPSPTFTGDVTISYTVLDATGTSSSTVEIDVGPIAADPVVWGTLSSTTNVSPSTTVPSLLNRIHDVNITRRYTFSNPVIPAGDGTITNLDAATGSFTYTAPDPTYIGTVAVQYSVSDGTNSTTGDVSIMVAPLVTQPVTVTELDHQNTVALTILKLAGAVQDITSNPSYTFSDLRVVDGGGSVPAKGFDDSTVGAFTYTLPSPPSAHPVHIEYSVSDGTNTANGLVTLQLVEIVANSANFSVLQSSTPSTLPALDGRIGDIQSGPTFKFSSPSVPAGDGTVQFTDATKGILSYTPPSLSFTGSFPIQYKVGDGTNSTSGVLNLTVAPLITSPLLIPDALQTQSTSVPSLVASGNVQDIASNPSYTFSNLIVAPGDGMGQFTSTTTGGLTYTPPSARFFGVVQVSYTVTDAAKNSATGDVIINVEQTIQPENDGPITAVLGQALAIRASQLLGNDIAAPDGLPPRIGSVGDAKNGAVMLNSNGSVTFVPTTTGPASFTYTDTDADGDASTVATVSLDVKLATTIDWANPGDIVHGTPLSSAQLDATANVPGTFTYAPAAGTVLGVGNGQTLSVVFTPFDAADYVGAYATTTINVQPAPPPGLTVEPHSFSGRVKHKVGGLIAQLHTTLSKLKTTYYSALINWGDGSFQYGKLAKSGNHAFRLNATHTYRLRGRFSASVTISDPLGNRLTESFFVVVHQDLPT